MRVEAGAESHYAAAVLALKAFHEHICAPGRAAQPDTEVKNPSVTHSLVVGKIEQWLAALQESLPGMAAGLLNLMTKEERWNPCALAVLTAH